MKNIHVLPTDKLSRLRYNLSNILVLTKEYYRDYGKEVNQHLYITSDEEIKKGDWCINPKNDKVMKVGHHGHHGYSSKKIILTTDQDLIADGVQAIDDEFLQWFVKNPSCEFVEIRKIEDELISPKNPKIRFNALQDPPSFISAESLNNMILTYKYKIIIPKVEPKQETLEEAAERLYPVLTKSTPFGTKFEWVPKKERQQFINGAKWQAERMYSEEEVVHIVQRLMYDVHCGGICEGDKIIDFKISPIKWFERFKKK